jgi:hypothetical protein
MSGIRTAACGISCAAILLAPLVRAEAPRATLDYRHPAGASCPDEPELRATIAARLGYDPFAATATRHVVVIVEPRGPALVGRFEIRDSSGVVIGRREIESSERDCPELISSLAVAVAIGIDPLSITRLSPSPSPSPVPLPVPALSPSPSLVTSLGAAATLGVTPEPHVAILAAVGVRLGDLSGAIEFRGDLPSRSPAGGRGSYVTTLHLAQAPLCLHRGVIGLCLLPSAGVFRARGEGISAPADTSRFHAALGVRAAFDLPLGTPTWSARIFVDLQTPLTRPKILLDEQEIWTGPPFTGALGAAIVGRF